MRFVVAVDGSESSLKAVKFTLTKLVKKDRKDELHLLMIIPRETTLDVIVDPFDMLHVSDNSLAAFGKSNLEPAEKLCNDADVPFEAHIVLTDEEVREELCERADKLGADVLVVGARGLGLLSRLILGSVSEYATNNAPCNVCIVR